ncbi:hypothetical protein BU26DRAFT_560740 [Trematosphaeria pertusa]|uniref:Uncharacterized protein n=1 Tax=Trematosphaeria pertusa TaxID=390896 RepID=A0A6A6ITH0_9PLEO|nr:uncharacterized protein BU26DRAFT_560740 [Trematosphaeria pertusa]KAF2253438.1 hypothetical protein BU26DRAFT_560740 [Trematosphaeria pertusa]
MAGLSPTGIRGPGTNNNIFFFPPYDGKQYDSPPQSSSQTHRSVRYPSALPDGKTLRSRNPAGSKYDVRATYPAQHVLRQPSEDKGMQSEEGALGALFLRARIPEEDGELRKMQDEEGKRGKRDFDGDAERSWIRAEQKGGRRRMVSKPPVKNRKRSVVLEKRQSSEEESEQHPHECRKCRRKARGHGIWKALEKYSMLVVCVLGFYLLPAAGAQQLPSSGSSASMHDAANSTSSSAAADPWMLTGYFAETGLAMLFRPLTLLCSLLPSFVNPLALLSLPPISLTLFILLCAVRRDILVPALSCLLLQLETRAAWTCFGLIGLAAGGDVGRWVDEEVWWLCREAVIQAVEGVVWCTAVVLDIALCVLSVCLCGLLDSADVVGLVLERIAPWAVDRVVELRIGVGLLLVELTDLLGMCGLLVLRRSRGFWVGVMVAVLAANWGGVALREWWESGRVSEVRRLGGSTERIAKVAIY